MRTRVWMMGAVAGMLVSAAVSTGVAQTGPTGNFACQGSNDVSFAVETYSVTITPQNNKPAALVKFRVSAVEKQVMLNALYSRKPWDTCVLVSALSSSKGLTYEFKSLIVTNVTDAPNAMLDVTLNGFGTETQQQ